MSLWSRIANLLHGDGLSREIADELQSHIEEAIEQGRYPEANEQIVQAARALQDEAAWIEQLAKELAN